MLRRTLNRLLRKPLSLILVSGLCGLLVGVLVMARPEGGGLFGSAVTGPAASSTNREIALLQWHKYLPRSPVVISAGHGPGGIAFDGANMWVTNSLSNNVSVIPINATAPSKTLSVGPEPEGIAFDGANMWVVNGDSDSVSVTPINGTIPTKGADVGHLPSAIAFDGANMWVANYDSNNVSLVPTER
ncbi:MAG: hypothetical protein HY675_00570 [Chloroflexi bacterium]|nr:hypothetical protein [Chloroflexota bacterium]